MPLIEIVADSPKKFAEICASFNIPKANAKFIPLQEANREGGLKHVPPISLEHTVNTDIRNRIPCATMGDF